MSLDEKKLINAFQNKKYKWRTVRGVSKETGFSQVEVKKYISSHGGDILKSSSVNTKGEQLFTSRVSYRNKANPFVRISSILKNRGG